jgi:hypothetical protein
MWRTGKPWRSQRVRADFPPIESRKRSPPPLQSKYLASPARVRRNLDFIGARGFCGLVTCDLQDNRPIQAQVDRHPAVTSAMQSYSRITREPGCFEPRVRPRGIEVGLLAQVNPGCRVAEGRILRNGKKSGDLPLLAVDKKDLADRQEASNERAWYHEPPYTWEESRDFYRAMSGGPVTVVHPPVPAKTEKPKRSKSPPQQREE